jgi:hypothetical protein
LSGRNKAVAVCPAAIKSGVAEEPPACHSTLAPFRELLQPGLSILNCHELGLDPGRTELPAIDILLQGVQAAQHTPVVEPSVRFSSYENSAFCRFVRRDCFSGSEPMTRQRRYAELAKNERGSARQFSLVRAAVSK